MVLRAMPRATFIPADSAGHLSNIEQPGVVVPAVAKFLASGP